MKKNRIILFSVLIILSILIIGAGAYFVINYGIGQSVLGISSVNVGVDGKVYWNLYGSSTSLNEQYVFSKTLPKYSFTDGSGKTVTPKNDMVLIISPVNSVCSYQTTKLTIKKPTLIPFVTRTINYYVLSNTERAINFDVQDTYGNTHRFDGTIIDQYTFNGKDGGKAIVTTQGALGSKTSCPEYSNVVLIDKKDFSSSASGYLFGNKDEFLIWGSSATASASNVHDNTQFTNVFKSYPSFDGSKVTGEYNGNLGYPTFTITADQEYFSSVVYLPPASSKPKVDSITAPSSINTGESSSVVVKIHNGNSNAGSILLSSTSSIFSLSPSSVNLQLPASGDITQTLSISASNNVGCGDITIKACSVSQFNEQNCDTKTKSICIIKKDNEETNKCGDGICESYENNATCPDDCISSGEELICNKWYQEPGVKTSYGFSLLGIINLFPQENQICKMATWLTILEWGILAIILIAVIVLILVNKNKK